MKTICVLTGVLLALSLASHAQSQSQSSSMMDCPMHKEHAANGSHQAVVHEHGTQAMGFSQDTTTHHFLMTEQGGRIVVTANDPNDKSNIEAIRNHLTKIAGMFSNGDFSTPMFVHDGVPPGVTSMKLLKDKITYKYGDIPSGGQVTIDSNDPVAVASVHDFLRFQITEHQTGDTLAVSGAH